MKKLEQPLFGLKYLIDPVVKEYLAGRETMFSGEDILTLLKVAQYPVLLTYHNPKADTETETPDRSVTSRAFGRLYLRHPDETLELLSKIRKAITTNGIISHDVPIFCALHKTDGWEKEDNIKRWKLEQFAESFQSWANLPKSKLNSARIYESVVKARKEYIHHLRRYIPFEDPAWLQNQKDGEQSRRHKLLKHR